MIITVLFYQGIRIYHYGQSDALKELEIYETVTNHFEFSSKAS